MIVLLASASNSDGSSESQAHFSFVSCPGYASMVWEATWLVCCIGLDTSVPGIPGDSYPALMLVSCCVVRNRRAYILDFQAWVLMLMLLICESGWLAMAVIAVGFIST